MTEQSIAGVALKPCPFCGGEPAIREAVGETWIICRSCNASAESKSRREVAVEKWNTRTLASGAVEADLKEAKRLIRQLRGRAASSRLTYTDRMAMDDRQAADLLAALTSLLPPEVCSTHLEPLRPCCLKCALAGSPEAEAGA